MRMISNRVQRGFLRIGLGRSATEQQRECTPHEDSRVTEEFQHVAKYPKNPGPAFDSTRIPQFLTPQSIGANQISVNHPIGRSSPDWTTADYPDEHQAPIPCADFSTRRNQRHSAPDSAGFRDFSQNRGCSGSSAAIQQSSRFDLLPFIFPRHFIVLHQN